MINKDDHISVTGYSIVYNVQYLFIIFLLHKLLIIYIGYNQNISNKSLYKVL